MMTRRSLEGALKCALRDFRREEAIAVTAKSSVSSQFKGCFPHGEPS